MEELRNSLQASLEEDATAEANSKKGFKKLVADLENTYAGLGRSLAAAKSNLQQAQQSLKNEERYLVEQKEEKKSAQEGLAAKEKQCENWAKTYAQQTAARYDFCPIFPNLSLEPLKEKLLNRSNKSLLWELKACLITSETESTIEEGRMIYLEITFLIQNFFV